MKVKVGINGFGRIGRNVFRAMQDHPELEVVAVNDLTTPQTLAHLLQYDSVFGKFPGDVQASANGFTVNGTEVAVLSRKDPAELPWRELGVEIVIESTGLFTVKKDGVNKKGREVRGAENHLTRGGAKKVIISAPAENEDITIVMGVNEERYDPQNHHVVSNASCTTNCLAPLVKVLHQTFGVRRGFMTTVHSYTNDQAILDQPHSDLRRARAAALSLIPTTSGAAKAVGLVLPELQGKLTGFSIRVPTPDVSLVDFVADLEQEATVAALNQALREAAAGPLRNILGYCDAPLVSRDFLGDPRSAVVDALSTLVIEGRMAKVIAWYDNEWGYSNRVVDLARYMAQKGL